MTDLSDPALDAEAMALLEEAAKQLNGLASDPVCVQRANLAHIT